MGAPPRRGALPLSSSGDRTSALGILARLRRSPGGPSATRRLRCEVAAMLRGSPRPMLRATGRGLLA
eukprot:12473788-Alexandrium_andersonii.AAC.1